MIWAKALPAGTSAQRAELIALTQAFKMTKGKRLNIYTDSRYAFATAHIHGEIYRRRGLLTSEGKDMAKILALLEALFLPKRLSTLSRTPERAQPRGTKKPAGRCHGAKSGHEQTNLALK